MIESSHVSTAESRQGPARIDLKGSTRDEELKAARAEAEKRRAEEEARVQAAHDTEQGQNISRLV